MVLCRLNPLELLQANALRKQRDAVDEMLAQFSSATKEAFSGDVLVDGSWDNPNHWVRYALLRKALGLSLAHEVGLVGPFRVKECSRTFRQLGIREIVDFASLRGGLHKYQANAKLLLSKTSAPHDILSWKLPHGFPSDFLYDGLLKRQRAACVDLTDPRLPVYVAEGLACLGAAEELLKAYDFKLLVLSHVINFQYAALAWMAVTHGIPVIALYGEFGVSRLVKINRPEEMWATTNRPTKTDFESLDRARGDALAEVGRAYIDKRRAGETKELAAIYSFQRRNHAVSRADICRQFEWDSTHPVIAVYAASWFDYPHMYGMSYFRDFLEWLETTLGAAGINRNVNWLFKAHPCDDWYGGVTLSDLMFANHPPHIQQASKKWNGAALMDAVDGLVTYHGTAGIEFAAIGKPVLLADRGWYHELGIAKWPRSRDEYLRMLASEWWKDLDLAETTHKARILAGWHFCRPSWQGSFVLEDDPVQNPIYATLPDIWMKNQQVIAREVKIMRDWFASSHRHYHTHKMGLAGEFLP